MKIDSLTSATLDQNRTLSLSITGTTDNGVMSYDNDLNDGFFVSPSIKIEDVNGGTRNNLALSPEAMIEFGVGGDNATDYSGIIVKFGTGSTTQGSVYYWKGSTNAWSLADNDNGVAHISYLLSYAVGTDPDDDGMMLQGIVSAEGHGFTLGAPLYVSSTPGQMTNSVPSSGYVRIVGYATNDDQIYFDPDKTWVEIA